MDISKAVRVCQTAEEMFARPRSWADTNKGRAVDLAGKISDRGFVSRVHGTFGPNLLKSPWVIKASELAEEWVLIGRQGLRREFKELEEAGFFDSEDA